MWSYRKPIIAQVHGFCLAGGNELVGACDIVFAAEDARFGHPASRALGIPPTLGMWPAKVGMLRTKELLFTGDLIDGREAERIGMVNHAVPADKLDETTMAFCQRVAMTPMDALTVHKHITNRWFEIAGLRLAAQEGADFDAIYHETAAAREFGRISREQGLKAALAWRDEPFAGPRTGHANE
jgi:enoyl-CoA hydratase